MKDTDIKNFKNFFNSYTKKIHSDSSQVKRNIELKENHTKRVVENIKLISNDMGLDNNYKRIAEAIALFHDIGRFLQFKKYKTFNDKVSTNHAKLSIEILNKNTVLDDLSKKEKNFIETAILNHNTRFIDRSIKGKRLFFTKLLRDSDKIDIYKVMIDYYSGKYEDKEKDLTWNLPETPGFSKKIVDEILNNKNIDVKYVKNINDLKLFQISWIFDINFTESVNLIKKRDYINKLFSFLPEKMEEINLVYNHVKSFIK